MWWQWGAAAQRKQTSISEADSFRRNWLLLRTLFLYLPLGTKLWAALTESNYFPETSIPYSRKISKNLLQFKEWFNTANEKKYM